MDSREYMLKQLETLVNIPSPSGMTKEATDYVMSELTRLGYKPFREHKGTVICCIGGSGHPLAISSHVDTLGAMVRSVKPNGHLKFTAIGGLNLYSAEAENVIVFTRTGKRYSGTIQSIHASAHVWGKENSGDRTTDTLEIVLDEDVRSPEDVKKLGIGTGDFVFTFPRFVVTDSGYVKSRHLDDKASASVLMTLAREVSEGTVKLARKVTLVFTVFEEEGHGASTFCKLDCEDLLAVDMGCIGDDLACTEKQVSICAMDSAGPFDREFTNELICRAEKLHLDYAVDIYPHYSSDASPALRSGLDARFALCGQGVFASHGYERTHVDGMVNTLALVRDVASELYYEGEKL